MKRILSLFIFICLLLLISILHIDNLAFNSKVEFVFEYLSVLVIVAIAITGYSAFRHEPIAIAGMSMFVLQKIYRAVSEIKFIENQFDKIPELLQVLLDDGTLLLGVFFLAIGIKRVLERYELSECIDELTSAFNRKAFNRIRLRSFDLVFFDLDDFKLVNDEKGHKFGDKVLINFSHCLKEKSKKKEMIIRFGGDEFIAILQPSRGESFLNNIESELELLGIRYSFGIEKNVDRRDLRTSINRADESLYKMKMEKKGAAISV